MISDNSNHESISSTLSPPDSRAIIIGAGISGLATAFYLQKLRPEMEVTVIEAAPHVGGTIRSERSGGFLVEFGPNGFLDTKPSTLELCRGLGIADQLTTAYPAARHRYLFVDNRLHLLPRSLWGLFRFPLLSLPAKARLLMEKYQPAIETERDESVYEFAARRLGPGAAKLIADALVTGIYAGDPHLISMRAAFPALYQMERQFGSVNRGMKARASQRRSEAAAQGRAYQPGGSLLSFRNGLGFLTETLARNLKTQPVLSKRVASIRRRENQSWIVESSDGQEWTSEFVILTCPAHQQAGILQSLDNSLANSIEEITYCPVVVVALGYREKDILFRPDGFGFIAPQATRRDILGAQWCSSIFPDRAPEGMVLLRALSGGQHRADILEWDDARIISAVRSELQKSMQISTPPAFAKVVRWQRAIPQYHIGHLERAGRIRAQAAQYRGLFLSGNAYEGVALNDCTENAHQAAIRIDNLIRSQDPC